MSNVLFFLGGYAAFALAGFVHNGLDGVAVFMFVYIGLHAMLESLKDKP